MASHHYQTHLPAACCCGCGGGLTAPCFQTHHPSPPPPSPSDPLLLHALASQILQSAQLQHCSHYPTVRTQKFLSHYQFQPLSSKAQDRLRELDLPQVSSLLSRIEALESSLHRVSASHGPPQSLRHAAASVIQTHFRAFLVRRSRALGQLKDLAIIKSSFESLKSSICNGFHFDHNAVSLEIMDLLLDLDSIQGYDPMVRDSKRAISRDLVQFLDQIDNLTVKRHGLPVKGMKNLRLSKNFSKPRVSNPKPGSYGDQKEAIEKLKSRVEKICERSRIFENGGKELNLRRFHHVGGDEHDEEEESPRIIIKENNQTRSRVLAKGTQPGAKKSVRFAENGSLFRVLNSGSNSPQGDYGVLDERDSSDELVEEDTCNEAVEIKEFPEVAEDEEEAHGEIGCPEISDGDGNPRRKMTSGDNYEFQGSSHGGSAFSAPLPLKMENKADLMKGRKSPKILG